MSGQSAVACCVEVRANNVAAHTGGMGDGEPDALTTLIKMLATLLDDGGADTEARSAGQAKTGMRDGISPVRQRMVATGPSASPPLTVVDMELTPSKGGLNVQPAMARARLAMRFAEGPAGEGQLVSLMNHLKAVAPNGARVIVEYVPPNPGDDGAT